MGTVEDARVALLERLIDHAPLFPPASLAIPDALAEDERARASAAAFVLGRFVCPASQLQELPDVGRGVSVVLDAELSGRRDVEAVEARWSGDLTALGRLAPEVYVELPIDDALEDRLDRLVASGLRAKVRCGGAQVPNTRELARFVRACRERELPFKATAGLHRAVARDGEHGFLNLLAAVVFAEEESALSELDPSAFAVDAAGFRWGDRLAGGESIALARRDGLRSIGSCSFFEPVEELEAMGYLPL